MKPMLPKDRPMKSGFLGRTKIKTVEGRVGYTEGETRFGQNSKSTKIPMPSAGESSK